MELSPKNRLILVIDSHPDHVQTIQSTLDQSAVCCDIVAIANGEEAMRYLHRQGDYSNAARPDIILLDLNLSQTASIKSGFEVLADIKADSHLKRIPIVVLTLSDDDTIIFNSYALQGNCYVLKSTNLEQLAHIVKRIEEFWLGIVTLPVE